MTKCNVCGSSNLSNDPAGYYDHAQREDGAPLLCLDGLIDNGKYVKPDHTIYVADLSPEHKELYKRTGVWPK